MAIGQFATDQYDSDADDFCYYCDKDAVGDVRDPDRGLVRACEQCFADITRGNELTAAYHAHQCRE